jgi:hypothetical protein
MPCPPELLKRVDEAIDNLFKPRALPVPFQPSEQHAPQQPFSDSPPEMPKENLWGGKPPIPVEHL